jgi:hypothetical protein
MKGAQDRRLSVLDAMRLLRHPLGLISLTALVGIAVAEIASASVRHVFATYPISVGLLTSIVTLAFTLSIVNQFVLQRASYRWADVRGITLKGLNDEIRSTRDMLWIALFGQPPYAPSSRTVSAAADIAKESNIQWPDASRGLFAGLGAVLSDGQWTQTGAAILRMATRQIREGLARWAPTTGLAGGDYHALSPIASLADIVEVLEFPLAAYRIDQAGSVAEKYRQPLCILWRHALTTCVYVEENIVRLLDPQGHWFSRAREMLSDSDKEDLKRWLTDATIFEKDSMTRGNALLELIDKPL